MSKHTPGPWSIGKVNPKKHWVQLDTGPCGFMGFNQWIGMSRFYGCSDAPEKGMQAAKANAQLASAAPELLQALQETLQSLEYVYGAHPETSGRGKAGQDMQRAREVIAKAIGEQA
jgi:hypothetical protein